MTNQNIEHYITDNANSIIDRKEVQDKLDRLEVYMRRVLIRVREIDNKTKEIQNKAVNVAEVNKALTLFKLIKNQIFR